MPDLDDAYGLDGPESSRRLYRDWAETYDTGFVAERGYVYHREVARVLLAGTIRGPVLDVGAGTGIVGEALMGSGLTLDALDISPEMLAVARGRGVYQRVFEADLTGPLPLKDGHYGAVVSSGTFTHGHVGPGCLPELMRATAPGARFALGINAHVFDHAGFGSALARLVADGQIGPLSFENVPIYEGVDHDAAGDRALVAVFERR